MNRTFCMLIFYCVCVCAGESSSEAKSVGVDQFWLIALKNCEIFADVIKVSSSP